MSQWLKQIDEIWLSTFKPSKKEVIQPLLGLEPKNIRLVILSDRPKKNSPFAFYDNENEYFYDKDTNQMTAYLSKMILIQSGDIQSFKQQSNNYEINNVLNVMKEKLPSIKDFFKKMKEFGVLFLNTSLSCGITDSDVQKKYHAQIWKPFIKQVISDILKERDCIFVCFGADAKRFSQHIQFNAITNLKQVKIINCIHPQQYNMVKEQIQENFIQQIKNAEVDLGYETSIDFIGLKLIDI